MSKLNNLVEMKNLPQNMLLVILNEWIQNQGDENKDFVFW